MQPLSSSSQSRNVREYAHKAVGSCRITIRYASTRADDDDLRERMRAMARERRRFDYRAQAFVRAAPITLRGCSLIPFRRDNFYEF